MTRKPPPDHAVLAHGAELMHRRHAADDGPILYGHMTAQLNAVGHDHMIADGAIVRHTGHKHEQAV
jgi:hypothetical protein